MSSSTFWCWGMVLPPYTARPTVDVEQGGGGAQVKQGDAQRVGDRELHFVGQACGGDCGDGVERQGEGDEAAGPVAVAHAALVDVGRAAATAASVQGSRVAACARHVHDCAAGAQRAAAAAVQGTRVAAGARGIQGGARVAACTRGSNDACRGGAAGSTSAAEAKCSVLNADLGTINRSAALHAPEAQLALGARGDERAHDTLVAGWPRQNPDWPRLSMQMAERFWVGVAGVQSDQRLSSHVKTVQGAELQGRVSLGGMPRQWLFATMVPLSWQVTERCWMLPSQATGQGSHSPVVLQSQPRQHLHSVHTLRGRDPRSVTTRGAAPPLSPDRVGGAGWHCARALLRRVAAIARRGRQEEGVQTKWGPALR